MRLINPAIVNDNLLSIDIGASGGFCHNGWSQDELNLDPMADSPRGIADYIRKSGATRVVAEEVHIYGAQMGGEKLVENRGILIGICAVIGVPISFIDPKEWLKRYTIKNRKHFKSPALWKRHLIEIAEKINPPINRKFTSGTCDAFLLWNYQASIIVNDKLPVLGELNFGI